MITLALIVITLAIINFNKLESVSSPKMIIETLSGNNKGLYTKMLMPQKNE